MIIIVTLMMKNNSQGNQTISLEGDVFISDINTIILIFINENSWKMFMKENMEINFLIKENCL